ncbi:MAG: sigma factor, partial [Planctomycetota bacterium]
MNSPQEDSPSVWDLRGISTQWSVVANANLFVLRYSDAIQEYLKRLLRNDNDVEDVLQLFLVKILENGFQRVSPDRGRFRNYLIRAVKNEVIDWQRAKSRRKTKPIE